MKISLFKSYTYSDVEYIRGIQQRDGVMEHCLYNDCRRYFMQNYKSVVSKGYDINPYNRERTCSKEDLFQEAFLHLWTEIENQKIFLLNNSVCRRKGDKVNPMTSNLRTFLLSIAQNKFKEQTRKYEMDFPDDFDNAASLDMEYIHLEQSDEELKNQIVADCVLNLPQRCKEILTMFYYKNMSLDEILRSREENSTKEGLKSGKYKCVKSLKVLILKEFEKFNLKPYTHERRTV